MTNPRRIRPSARKRFEQMELHRAIEERVAPAQFDRLLRDRWAFEREGWVVETTLGAERHGFVVYGADASSRFGILLPDEYPESRPVILHCSDAGGLSRLCACVAPVLGSWTPDATPATAIMEAVTWFAKPLAERDADSAACRCSRSSPSSRSSVLDARPETAPAGPGTAT